MSRRLLARADRRMASWVESIPKAVRPFFVLLATTTHPVAWSVVLLGAAVVAWSVEDFGWMYVFLAVLLLLPLEQLLKYVFRRARPETMYVDNMRFRSYSFPSGHAYAAALVVGLFAIMAYTLAGGLLGLLLGAMLAVFALIIGVSRVYLGAHFPSDVLAGWMIGLIVLICLLGAIDL